MRTYREEKAARTNRIKAIFITASIYFLLFTGVFFAMQPEKLPDFVKELLNIEKVEMQEENTKDRA